jgi:hypothetical protein
MCRVYTPNRKAADSRIILKKECDFFKSPSIVFSERYKKAPEANANNWVEYLSPNSESKN